jgi:hypothetical protein
MGNSIGDKSHAGSYKDERKAKNFEVNLCQKDARI